MSGLTRLRSKSKHLLASGRALIVAMKARAAIEPLIACRETAIMRPARRGTCPVRGKGLRPPAARVIDN